MSLGIFAGSGARAWPRPDNIPRLRGTHDTRKIGRRSSNGCIGLYNEHIAALCGLMRNGTQVLLI